uniref:Zinc finger protein 26 n=1 Tax=Culex pipiens TaxID=7175 RepID=A0A8D8E3I9_CULPI
MLNATQFSREPSRPNSLDDFCRVCLLRKPSLRPLTGQSCGVMIPEMLYKLTGTMLNVQDQLPGVICERCLVKLELAYSITEEFRRQEELLRQFLWKGGSLVGQLVEYGLGVELRPKPHSEEVIGRLVEEGRTLDEPKPTIKREPLDVVDDFVEHRSEEDSNLNDGMVVKDELPDKEADGTSFEVKILSSPVESDQDDDGGPETRGDGFIQSPMESGADDDDFEEEDDDRDVDFQPNYSRVSTKSVEDEISEILADDATKCPDCDKEFPTPLSLRRHYRRHLVRKKGMFRCDECNKNFASKADLRLHEVTHINKAKKSSLYECKYCWKIFTRKYRLGLHEKRHEQENDVVVKPKLVEELQATPQETENQPSASGSNSTQKIYECKHCKKVFAWQCRHKQHEEQCEKLRPSETQQQEAPTTDPASKIAHPPYFECALCPKIFLSGARFRHHLKLHEKKQADEAANPTPAAAFPCPKCKCSYEEEWKLELHLQRHATVESGKYRCKTCDHAFATPMDLRRHEKKHASRPEWRTPPEEIPAPLMIVKKDRKFFKCRKCVKIFVNKSTYFSHAQIHVAIKTGAFKCPHCPKRYGQRCRLRMHLREKHDVYLPKQEEGEVEEGDEEGEPSEEREQTLLHCEECDAIFSTEESYEVHLREHRSEGLVEVGSGGELKQESPNSASDHQPSAIEEVRVKQEPTFDDDSSQTQDSFKRVKTESPMVVLPIQNVEVVQQPTPGSSSFGNETFDESKEFKCELCGKCYSQRGVLNRHIRHVHKLDGSSAVSAEGPPADTRECEECKKYIKRKLFSEHRKHHENVRLRKFVCPLCDKAFRTNHHQKEHVATRACEKTSEVAKYGGADAKYKCVECGKAYNNSQSIDSHMKRHKVLREERYKCGICQKVFGAKRELEVHNMRVHEAVL